MAEVRWIKLFIDMWNNRKIKQIETLPDGDTVLIIWLKLLTLAGNINDGGMVYFTKDIPFNEQMLANEFGRPLETVKMALGVFEKFGMVELFDDMIFVSNWQKYQNTEGMERVREQTRKRVAAYRERQALPCNATVTLRNATERREKKEERRKEDKSVKRFTPPTLNELQAFCAENNLTIDCERFIDYYSSNGWMVGRTHMKDWKAAARNWSRRDNKTTFTASEMDAGELDMDELRRKLYGGENV